MTRRAPAGAAVLQPHVTLAITDAVLHEWADKGYARLSMEAVARRAGVGKSALYRRWPSKRDMVLAVLDGLRDAAAPIRDTGAFRGDIHALMRTMLEWLTCPRIAPIVADMVAETTHDPKLKEAVAALLRTPQRTEAQPIFDRAIARGELKPDIDPHLVLELLAANIYWRTVVRVQPVTDDDIDTMITTLHEGLRPIGA